MSSRSIILVSAAALCTSAACSSEEPRAKPYVPLPAAGSAGKPASGGSSANGSGGASGSTSGGSANVGGTLNGAAGTVGEAGATNSGGASSGGTSSGTGGAGPVGGRDGQGGTSNGSAGTAGGGGSAGSVSAQCGNNQKEAGEQCDGTDLQGLDCTAFGFDSGTLKCADCTFDTSSCVGAERCFDGADNDGDRKVDCADSDCQSACASSCTEPQVLTDPDAVSGDTTGHASQLDSGCHDVPSGPEVVYSFTAKTSGVLDITLTNTGKANLNVSVHKACVPTEAPLACTFESKLKTPINLGETVFITVDGTEVGEFGKYELSVISRAVSCGDSKRDLEEQCDDGNKLNGDGCSASCQVEPDESEPNDTYETADSYVERFVGVISPAEDKDFIKYVLSTPAKFLTIQTQDFGDGVCALGQQDTEIALYDASFKELKRNDDTANSTNRCAKLDLTDMPAGTYYIQVLAHDVTAPLQYVLNVSEAG